MKFILHEAIDVLKQTPGTLGSLLGNISDSWLTKNEGPDTWSPYDVVGHLISGEETDWIPRLKIILEHGESKTFTPFDRFAFFEASKGKSIHQLLETFQKLRAQNVQTLESLKLTSEQLELKGTHPEFGPVTVEQLLATWVAHDLGHIHQIVRT
ncbi:MAG: DinB family protein, partial [Pseudomonadales bacterium]|nr:DinB family protein [Pseudomonadales bacterium]